MFPITSRGNKIAFFFQDHRAPDLNITAANTDPVKAYAISDNHIFYQVFLLSNITQPAFTCSKLTIETLEQGVKYVQS